jgi:hypothetical protein
MRITKRRTQPRKKRSTITSIALCWLHRTPAAHESSPTLHLSLLHADGGGVKVAVPAAVRGVVKARAKTVVSALPATRQAREPKQESQQQQDLATSCTPKHQKLPTSRNRIDRRREKRNQTKAHPMFADFRWYLCAPQEEQPQM